MDANRFDAVSRFFAHRRLSRRQALTGAGLGVAAGVLAGGLATRATAQDATPAAPEAYDPSQRIPYLFVQSFEGGTIAPKEGEDGTYTVALAHGTGQTIYFSDRPARDVGAAPTAQFLEGLGFSPSNPPNAALVVEPASGETDIAVVELFNPIYDPTGPGVTYDVKVLANWEDSLELGLAEAPADLAALAPSFRAAHLFIDDCADSNVSCCPNANIDREEFGTSCTNAVHDYGTMGFCYNYLTCVPCVPYYHTNPYNGAAWDYWSGHCNNEVPACAGRACTAGSWL